MIVTSTGLLKVKGLSALVGEPIAYYRDLRLDVGQHTAVAGWGAKKSFVTAQDFASQHKLKLVCLEDGFIRSLGLGKEGAQPLSIVMDGSGIYFDSQRASDLEQLIAHPIDNHHYQRAKKLITSIIHHGITKYNQFYIPLNLTQFKDQQNILVIDQTYGDQSICAAQATPNTFKVMLNQALKDHPDAIIWVKTHPDVVGGRAKGHFSRDDFDHPRIRICCEPYNPLHVLSVVDHVYVVSSHMGFEALMCGKPVSCFGLPWYAGWGLTDDRHAPCHLLDGRRGIKRSVEHLFACAYLKYAHYISPITHKKCELEEIIELFAVNIYFQQQLSGKHIGYGFSSWKKKFIRDFLNFPKTKIGFKKLGMPATKYSIVSWGKNAQKLKNLGYPSVWAVEDGFVRSRGLGANLTRPYSLVFDDVGIYYDATRPSKLESILNQIELNQDELTRASQLITKLIQLNITKYNVGDEIKLQRPHHGRVILITGQVEDDLSVQLGGLDIKTNLALIQHVRINNPNAYIIYKPHPDVHAGLRLGRVEERLALEYVDNIEVKRSILECFEICDEVHTISSLSGFEGLLRGLQVHCYGMPFYAGWGLTTDLKKCERRLKMLTLEQLVYGVLIRYAVYNLPQTSLYNVPLVNVEDVIDYIAFEKSQGFLSPNLKSKFAKMRATIIYNLKGS